MNEGSKTRPMSLFRRLTPLSECAADAPDDAPEAPAPKTYVLEDVKDKKLCGHDLAGAILVGLDFGEADLQGADLRDADLTEADLHRVKNLLPEQLNGANLAGAELPPDIAKFDALDHVEDLSQNAGKLLVSLLAACAFMLLTIARVTDLQLVTDSATAKLPIVDAEIGVKLFFVFGPIVLLGVYFAFHLYLQRLWETLASLPAVFPDGIPLDRKTYPWLVNDLVRLHFSHLRQDCMRSPLMYFQEKLWGFVAYWLPPILLLPFWARYLCCRNWWVTGANVLALAAGVWFAVMFAYLASITLDRDKAKIKDWQSDWLKNSGSRLAAWASGTAALFLALSWAAFEGLPPEAPVSGSLPHRVESRLAQALPWLLDLCHAPAFVRFEDANPAGQRTDGSTGAGGNGPAAPRLRYADLRYARAQGASLAEADLRQANLEHANLQDADLTDANLEGARLKEAQLDYTDHKFARNWFLAYYDDTQIRNLGLLPNHDTLLDHRLRGGPADLRGYKLVGAPLERATLRFALLQNASLQYTDLSGADLQNADLSGASLRGADLSGANMSDVNFMDTDVQDADFKSATLTGSPPAAQSPVTPVSDTGGTNPTIFHARNWLLAHYNAQQMHDLGLPRDHEAHLGSNNFDGYQFGGDDLHKANLIRLSFHGAVFYLANLSGADLRAAQLQHASFYGANLQSVILSDADLSDAYLGDANLQKADLRRANLSRADLTSANLTGALYDHDTTWPNPNFAKQHPEMVRQDD